VLQKGVTLIVRVHDPNGLVPQREVMPGTGVSAFPTGAAVKQFPLPMTYDNGRIRYYSAVVPLSSALSAVVSSGGVALADKTGAALSALGTPFQVTAADISGPEPPSGSLVLMFPRPDAKVIHVYVTGQK
jgi:hypothetical protein